jgi:hypothetical protein
VYLSWGIDYKKTIIFWELVEMTENEKNRDNLIRNLKNEDRNNNQLEKAIDDLEEKSLTYKNNKKHVRQLDESEININNYNDFTEFAGDDLRLGSKFNILGFAFSTGDLFFRMFSALSLTLGKDRTVRRIIVTGEVSISILLSIAYLIMFSISYYHFKQIEVTYSMKTNDTVYGFYKDIKKSKKMCIGEIVLSIVNVILTIVIFILMSLSSLSVPTKIGNDEESSESEEDQNQKGNENKPEGGNEKEDVPEGNNPQGNPDDNIQRIEQ